MRTGQPPRYAILAVLMAVSTIAVSGCARMVFSRQDDAPHRDVSCARCHAGALSERPVASVPSETCSTCHVDIAAPGADANGFDHDVHLDTAQVPMGCAGCHTHSGGNEPVSQGRGTCVLCHQDQMEGEGGEDCTACHREVDTVAMTSQGVPIQHQAVAWIQDECLRCHYEVTGPGATDVDGSVCATCHDASDPVGSPNGHTDTHTTHVAVACASCHEQGNHRIRSMSSAVQLRCNDCHSETHAVDERSTPAPGVCNGCHSGIHSAQQRFLLGLETGAGAGPHAKFLSGLTCRSCHSADASASPGTPIRGTCTSCHPAQYDRVADWWIDGAASRGRMVGEYVAAGRQAAARSGPEGARVSLDEADALLALAGAGGGVHNLPLTHLLLEEALAQAEQSFRVSGAVSPPPPELGGIPRPGFCSFCHYDIVFEAPEVTLQKLDAFHTQVSRSWRESKATN